MGEEELERALASLAAEIAPGLVERARADAAEEVRATLTRRLSAALLRACEAELSGPPPAPEPESEASPEAAPRSDSATAPSPGRDPEPEPPAHPLAEQAREDVLGCYVYGVLGAGVELPGDLAGVDPARPVRLVAAHGLAAIVSEVSLAEFGEETIRERLEDVAWLEETARGHEDVLDAALDAAAVVPLRLCTVFHGEGQVREMLGREREVLLDALERLAGKAEWGVKAFAGTAALEREVEERRGGGGEEAELPAGTAYLNRKRREAQAREEVEEVADEWAQLIHASLAEPAAEALLNPLQPPEVSGHEGEMLLNGVYLVAMEEAPRLCELVASLRDDLDRKGVEIVLTGPWPAYNFVKSSIEAAR